MSYIRLLYADIIFEGVTEDMLNRLERLQIRGLRTLHFDMNEKLETDKLRKRYNITSLKTRRKQHLANFMFSRSKTNKCMLIEKGITRRGGKTTIHVLQPKIEKAKKAIAYKGAVLWNKLSTDHQNSKTKNEFKTKTKAFI